MRRYKNLHYVITPLYLLVGGLIAIAAPDSKMPAAPVATVGAWKSADGATHYSYNGKEVSAAEFDRRCALDSKRKVSFKFEQHPTANKGDLVKMILIEARCTGATHIGFTGIDQYN